MSMEQSNVEESMLKAERHQIILEELKLFHRVKSSSLCKRFQVSEDTIRRDLNELAEKGHLKKVHGGAVTLNFIPGFKKREVQEINIKHEIAQKALKLIKDDQVLIIDGGTSNLQLVNILPRNLHLTIFTNSIPLANKICEYENIDGFLIGGNILKKGLVALGQNAIDTLKEIQADICFLGLTNLHTELGLTEANQEETYLKKVIIQSSDLVVSMMVSNKLGSNRHFKVAPIEALDILVTELDADDEKLKPYAARGIEII